MKIGLIGAGYLGTIHARLLAGQGLDWLGIYDLDPAKADKVAADFNAVPVHDLARAIGESDAVVIAAATSSHYALAKQALSAGKHVFLEKPITTTPAEGEELCALAKANKLVLQVGHVERFNRAYRSLGTDHPRPQFIEAHRMTQFRPRGTDVAVVLDLMIHDLDLILNLVGEFPSSIDASGVAVVSEAADIANARLKFPSGAVANVTASRLSANPLRKLRMFSTDSYISLDFATGSTQVFRLAKSEEMHLAGTVNLGEIDKGAVKRKILFSQGSAPEGNAIEMEQRAFIEAVRSGTPPPVTGEDGLAALKVATAILKEIGTHEVATGRD